MDLSVRFALTSSPIFCVLEKNFEYFRVEVLFFHFTKECMDSCM